MKYTNLVPSILLLLMVTLVSITPAYAAYTNNTWNVTGWVYASDTLLGIPGLSVSNASNATQITVTNASGGFNLPVTNTSVSERTLTISANAGYTQNTSVKFNISGADNNSRNVYLIIITPTISGVTESTPTTSGETISWTVTATDGVNNNNVGSRIRYSMDSALATNYFFTAWSNTTVSPSFALSNLQLNTKYYYQVETHNSQNGTYQGTATGDFTTKSGTHSYPRNTPTPTPGTGGFNLPFTGGAGGNGNIGLIMLVIVGLLGCYILFGGKKGGKKKR